MNQHALAGGPHEAAVLEAITRLTAEFASEHPPSKVGRTVLGSRRDLSGVPGGALPNCSNGSRGSGSSPAGDPGWHADREAPAGLAGRSGLRSCPERTESRSAGARPEGSVPSDTGTSGRAR